MNFIFSMLNRSMLTLSIFFIFNTQYGKPTLLPHLSSNKQLKLLGLLKETSSIRLHLGCGEQTLPNYINIDFSPSNHTVQQISGADCFADITTLSFENETVDEIRLHHVFEHFDRVMALTLLCIWHRWLKLGGSIILETPDMEQCAQLLVDQSLSYKEKQIVIRHLFGSHEAFWAVHKDGWYKEKFENALQLLGFSVVQVIPFRNHKLIPNIIIQAVKTDQLSPEVLINRAQGILRYSLIDDSSSEESIWLAWRNILYHNLNNNCFSL